MSSINEIPKGWIKTVLGDIVDSANTGLDAIKRAPIVEEETGIKCFRIQDASQKKKYKNWGNTKVEDKNYRKFRLLRGDILIARTGNTIGVNHLVKEDIKSVFNNGLIRLRVNDKCDYTFLYKIIESKLFDRYVQSIAYGTSTQPNMQINVLLGFDLLLPSYEEQKAIAKILTAFDDKIENLQAQNKILETTAQTIFKEWFGKYQIGDDLPEGWRVSTIDEVVELIIDYRGKTPKKLGTDWSETGIPALSAKTIKNGKIVRRDAMNYGSEKLYSIWMKYELKKGDILLTSEAPLGEMYYLNIGEKYILSQRLFALRTNENITSQYLYHYLFFKYGQHLLQSRASGSTVEGIRQSELRKVEVIIPDKEILDNASKLFQSIFDKKSVNSQQIQTLKKTRDTLLPKLMSGSLRVNDFKETVV